MLSNAPVADSFATPPVSAGRAVRLGLSHNNGASTITLGDVPQTIGGGPKCSVRLQAAGLRPLHCVITPTPEGPVVRRWAADTQLNGGEFTEARLTAGDALRIGSVDLQIVEMGDPSAAVEETPQAQQEPTEAVESPAAVADSEPVTCDSEPPSNEGTTLDQPATPAAEEATPAAEWIDDSVEQLRETLTNADTPAEPAAEPEVDPAVPSRLLKPWGAADSPSVAAANRDTASSMVELNDFPEVVEPAAEATESASVETATSDAIDQVVEEEPTVADEWAVEPLESPEEPVSSFVAVDVAGAASFESLELEPVATGAEASIDAFEVATAAPIAPPEALPADAVEPEAVVADVTVNERLVERVRIARGRIGRLIAALRNQREHGSAWEAAVSERDGLIENLNDRLAEAVSSAELAAQELTSLGELTSQLQASEDALAEAQQRIAALEAEVVELTAAARVSIEDEAVEPEPLPADEALLEVEAVVEADAVDHAAAPAPEEGMPEAASLWGTPQESSEDASDEATPIEAEASHVEADAAPAPEPVAPAADLWGIERLASEASSPEASAVEVEASVTTEPVVEPSDSDLDLSGLAAELIASGEPDAVDSLDAAAVQREAELLSAAEDALATVPSAVAPVASPEPETAEDAVEQALAQAADDTPKTPHEAPASFIEQYAHMLPEDDGSAVEPIEPVVSVAAEPEPIASADGDDESIDDYMRKLMSRMRGEEAPVAAAPTPQPEAAPQKVVVEAPVPVEPPAPVIPIRDLAEMKRETAPLHNTDLGALRQLANQSARHAIDAAETRTSREQATLRLTASAVALGCGALAAITAASPFGLQFVGGLLGLSAGGWFGVRTLRACQQSSVEEEFAAQTRDAD